MIKTKAELISFVRERILENEGRLESLNSDSANCAITCGGKEYSFAEHNSVFAGICVGHIDAYETMLSALEKI